MPYELIPPEAALPAAASGYELIPPEGVVSSAAAPAVAEPDLLSRLGRQAGLTGRYLLEGAAGFTDPLNRALGLPLASQTVGKYLTQAGLPEPETPTERVVGDISRTLVPLGGQMKIASQVAEKAAGPIAREVGSLLTQAPAVQATAATAGGAAGGIAGEMGADPMTQWLVSLSGGMTPGLAFAPAAARSVMFQQPPRTLGEMARIKAMQDVGVTNPPQAAITRSPQDWYAWQELGKQEGAAKDVFVARNQAANDQLSSVLPSMRQAPESTPYEQAEAARGGVAAYKADARNVAQGTYDAAAKAPGADTPFPAADFFAKAHPIVQDFEDALPGAITKRLQQLQAGERFQQTGDMTPGVSQENMRYFTVGEAAQLYKLINDRMSGAMGPIKAAGGQLKAALADAGSTLQGEPGTAMQLFQDATQQWRTMKQTMMPTPISALGKIPEASPQFLTNLFTKGKPGEISALADLLSQNTPSAAAMLHDALLDQLQGKATQAANGRFSGAMLGKAIDTIGPERMASVLSPQELTQIDSLRTASEALTVEPDLAAVNRSNTGSTLGNLARRFHFGPATGAILGGMLGEHLGIPGAGEILGAGAGAAGEGLAAQLAGRRMRGMYPLGGPPQPTLEDTIARLVPLLIGASSGSATGLGR